MRAPNPLDTLRSEKERTLRPLAIAVSILAWIGLVVSIVGAIYGIFIAAFIAIAHALFMSHVRGNGVKLGPDQLPEIWARVVRASEKLGLTHPPEAYVLQSGGVLNAFATKVLGRRFVVLFSQLLEHEEALDFIIAHEVGHIAAGHLSWFLLPSRAIPLFGHAFSRACEYTADRCGEFLVGDPEVAARSLVLLAAGGKAAARVNLDAFEQQRNDSGDFWMAVYELNSSHPYLPKRVSALRNKTAAPISRNFLSYPLAPMLAFGTEATSGALVMMMVIGIMAATAIPAFEKYLQRSKELAAAPPVAAGRVERSDQVDQIRGGRFSWHMTAPGPKWEAIPDDQARQQNAAADRWLTRPDLDAHLIIIPEYTGGTPLSMEAFTRAVVANMKRTSKKFKILQQEDRPDGTRLITAESITDGQTLRHLYELRLEGDYAYQILALAPAPAMPQVKEELMVALNSFSPGS